jgi:hypothetical protein
MTDPNLIKGLLVYEVDLAQAVEKAGVTHQKLMDVLVRLRRVEYPMAEASYLDGIQAYTELGRILKDLRGKMEII